MRKPITYLAFGLAFVMFVWVLFSAVGTAVVWPSMRGKTKLTPIQAFGQVVTVKNGVFHKKVKAIYQDRIVYYP